MGIDTNLGDLNANGIIDTDQQVYSGYANTLVGEQYDPNYGVARTSNTAPWDEAHFYRECSNKGVCNRKTGICDCFPGFEGEGCRRMSCPLDCNGHGRCQLIEHEKLNTAYTLWDQDKVQRCKCDPGYSGPDFSARVPERHRSSGIYLRKCRFFVQARISCAAETSLEYRETAQRTHLFHTHVY